MADKSQYPWQANLQLPILVGLWLFRLLLDGDAMAEIPFGAAIRESFLSLSHWVVLWIILCVNVGGVVGMCYLSPSKLPILAFRSLNGARYGSMLGFFVMIGGGIMLGGLKKLQVLTMLYGMPLCILFGALAGMWVHLWQMRREPSQPDGRSKPFTGVDPSE